MCRFVEQRDTMWITLLLITLGWASTSQAGGNRCELVLTNCRKEQPGTWTRCYEDKIRTCSRGRFPDPEFIQKMVNSSEEANETPTPQHRVRIPPSALRKSAGTASEQEVVVVATVLNSTYFTLSPSPGRGRMVRPQQPTHIPGTVLGGLVLAVKAGNLPVANLTQPIKLTFKHDKQGLHGTCVFWEDSEERDGTGRWGTDGCDTSNTGQEFICSCNHLSFFAVLVNPQLSVSKSDAVKLSYITYVGSALSVIFTIISLIIYGCLHRRRPEKAITVHMQLTGALLCLHLSFLLCSLWGQMLNEHEDSWVCQLLGLVLHWSLLATFSWTALEGFHLYLLLVRVFNIYVRRYLLKLSVVGWGLPTLVAVICGISGVYGKYSLQEASNHTSTAQMCWMSSQFPHMLVVSYVTTVAFPSLVILYNSCMLGLVVFKIWRLRGGSGNSSGWKKVSSEKRSRLWKDCATLLGLSCVLGLSWGLIGTTYMTLSGIYIFTIFNSLQGVFIFLWSVALTCKSQSDDNSSSRDPSSQKIMTTSFNN